MQITKDVEFSQYILKVISDKYAQKEPRTGKWHVSDILFPRYAVLNRRNPQAPTPTAIGYFFMGEAIHEFIQKLLGRENSEVSGELFNITSHADFFGQLPGQEETTGTLIEFKTSRKWTVPEEPEEHYIEQASMYCCIYDVKKVKIVAIYPTAGRKWGGSAASTVEVVSWNVEFSDEDLSSVSVQMLNLRDQMNDALRTGNIQELPLCPAWKCGTVERDKEKQEYFLEVRCPFYEVCGGNPKLRDDLKYKNDHRRVKK